VRGDAVTSRRWAVAMITASGCRRSSTVVHTRATAPGDGERTGLRTEQAITRAGHGEPLEGWLDDTGRRSLRRMTAAERAHLLTSERPSAAPLTPQCYRAS
jgi:hypothetical protein